MVQIHFWFMLPLALHLTQFVTAIGAGNLPIRSIPDNRHTYLLQKGFHLSKVANNRFASNVADILRMIVGGGFIQLLFGLSRIDTLQDANTSINHQEIVLLTENLSKTNRVCELPVISSRT